jgi:hypothetical protein
MPNAPGRKIPATYRPRGFVFGGVGTRPAFPRPKRTNGDPRVTARRLPWHNRVPRGLLGYGSGNLRADQAERQSARRRTRSQKLRRHRGFHPDARGTSLSRAALVASSPKGLGTGPLWGAAKGNARGDAQCLMGRGMAGGSSHKAIRQVHCGFRGSRTKFDRSHLGCGRVSGN